jgi:L-gulono-1,4-lactone dehydrogenase
MSSKDGPLRRPVRWRNWSREQQFHPTALFEPRDAPEVCEAISLAASEGRRLRVIGSGYSSNDIAQTDGYLLTLRSLDKIIDVDAVSGRVQVDAGVTLHALNAHLRRMGLSLTSFGSIDRQTVAGAIATDTHGSAMTAPSLCDRVESVQMATGSGSLVEIDASDRDALRAARVNLGALGVVTALTLTCEPAYVLRESRRVMQLDDLLGNLDDLVRDNDHLEFWAFPWDRRALVTMRNRAQLPWQIRRSNPLARARRIMAESYGVELCCRVARRWPGMTASISHMMSATLQGASRVGPASELFLIDRPLRVGGSEWAVPLVHAANAVGQTGELLASTGFPSPIPMGVRFCAPSDGFLSNASGRAVCHIDLVVYHHAHWQSSYEAVDALMDTYDGRPHWGKHFDKGWQALARLYPDWERFQAVRRRLDPGNLFANAYIERVLGTCPASQTPPSAR